MSEQIPYTQIEGEGKQKEEKKEKRSEGSGILSFIQAMTYMPGNE